jgi:NAD-dependent DNA ligase
MSRKSYPKPVGIASAIMEMRAAKKRSGGTVKQQRQPAICPRCGSDLYTEGEAAGACTNFDCTYEISDKKQA